MTKPFLIRNVMYSVEIDKILCAIKELILKDELLVLHFQGEVFDTSVVPETK